mmetsp:Transcript_39530/g.103451  ORF Transcript_39530/g.103451 Transcript_39530/m.103451 type:complete len:200 (+) Transcript_39530:1394-1993(+)
MVNVASFSCPNEWRSAATASPLTSSNDSPGRATSRTTKYRAHRCKLPKVVRARARMRRSTSGSIIMSQRTAPGKGSTHPNSTQNAAKRSELGVKLLIAVRTVLLLGSLHLPDDGSLLLLLCSILHALTPAFPLALPSRNIDVLLVWRFLQTEKINQNLAGKKHGVKHFVRHSMDTGLVFPLLSLVGKFRAPIGTRRLGQ